MFAPPVPVPARSATRTAREGGEPAAQRARRDAERDAAALASTGLLIQRKCACGCNPSNGDDCAPEGASAGAQAVVQRKAGGEGASETWRDAVAAALASAGRPLDTALRESMQAHIASQLPHRVPGHAAPRAPLAAHAADATHAGQLRIGPATDAFEREADAVAAALDRFPGAAAREERSRFDFSAVRVHDNAASAASARALGALAYTVGPHLVFGASRYAPHSASGRRLIAHELTHVAQQGAAPLVLRRASDTADASDTLTATSAAGAKQEPSAIGMSVSLDGLSFEVPDNVLLKPGRRSPQLLAIALRRLLGAAYHEGLETEVEAALNKGKFQRFGGFKDTRPARGGEPVGRIAFQLPPTLALLGVLEAKGLKTVLTPDQEELLRLGVAHYLLWGDFVGSLKESGLSLPKWYTRTIFELEIAQNAALLKQYAAQVEAAHKGDEAARVEGRRTLADVIDALYGPAMILEAVRLDLTLAAKPATGDAYAGLWRLPSMGGAKAGASKAGTPQASNAKAAALQSAPTKLRDEGTAVLFLGYLRTQPDLARNAEVDAQQRATLVERFGRFTASLTTAPPEAPGDQQLRDTPVSANRPAFPSTLSVVPESPPPLYNAALGTDHRFSMSVEFPSVYEALGRYAFYWERVRIPDESLGKPIDVSKLRGERVGMGDVAAVRFSRDTAWAEADIRHTIDTMRSNLGAPGIGALELVGANAILRYVGTSIKLALDILTMPAEQKLVTFPAPGLYMVRAAMSQLREGGEEVVRAPSVAYQPVLAREPDEMARGGVQAAVDARGKTEARIHALEARLAANPPPEERAEIEHELAALRLALGPMSARLAARRADAAKLESDIEAGRVSGDLETATQQRESLDKIIALRARRAVSDTAEPLTARFVGDLGQALALSLEVVDRTPPGSTGNVHVYLSDITTPKSGDSEGVGKTRDEAIADGVRKLLESIHGYGRGRVALALGGAVQTIRIDASEGSLLMEAVENVSTALSVAALAAAPLTGGATLAFLVPLGMVGAIPSAYRVVERLEAGTFEFDLENALDLVNIAGSVIGLGRMGATSLRAMRMGRALLVVGFGIDAAGGVLMGENLLRQIDALAKLPPGERSSALLLLMGQTLMSAGVMAGGSLAEHAQQAHAGAKAGGPREAGGKTGGGALEEHPQETGAETSRKTAAPAGEASIDRTRVDMEMSQLGRMDAESEARLRADEPLREALVDQPLAASALKKCASPCYPRGISAEMVKRLDSLLKRLGATGEYNERALKDYLYARRENLPNAIAEIEGVKSAADLNGLLENANRASEGPNAVPNAPANVEPQRPAEPQDAPRQAGTAETAGEPSEPGTAAPASPEAAEPAAAAPNALPGAPPGAAPGTSTPRGTISIKALGRVGEITSKRTFRRFVTRTIQRATHPLHKLLDPATRRLLRSTTKGLTALDWFEDPRIVEAGHYSSAKGLSGAPDRLVIMSAYENRLASATIEHPSIGGIMQESGHVVAIDGLPVDLRTAEALVEFGVLKPEELAAAPLIVY